VRRRTLPLAATTRSGQHAAVSESARYTPDEERALRAAHAAGEPLRCPRCDVPMTHRPIGGGSFGLGYRRRREWLLCPGCRRSALFDAQRGTRT
jgi:hypothetical protein